MPVTNVGQLYTPSNASELRDQFLRDVRLGAIAAGVTDPPVTPGTDWYILGTAVANLCLIGLANTTIGLDAQSVLDATGADLDKIRIAFGLPEIPPTPASGKIRLTVTGVVTLTDGTQFLYPSGLRGAVVGTFVNPADGDEVPVTAVDSGSATDLAGGTIVRFINPPVGIATEATVSIGSPLTEGSDAESDEQKRARILDTLRNKPAGGNWARIRELAREAIGSISDCYVYPALGGPASAKIVPVKAFDRDRNDYSRSVSTAALATVQTAVQADAPTPSEMVFQASADQSLDATLQVTIPASALSGGNGSGWTDPTPWPSLVGGDSGKVTITAVTSGAAITVSAATTTPPVDGQSHIAWWSSVDRKFRTALVTAHGGATTAWTLTLDRSLIGTNAALPQVGDYICPAAVNLERYGDAWVSYMESMGPGENTADSARLPRAKRHPYVSDEDPSDLTNVSLARISNQFPEITQLTFGYTSVTTPTVPGSVDTAPNILVPRKFGVYPS